jgi:hypothetical protein
MLNVHLLICSTFIFQKTLYAINVTCECLQNNLALMGVRVQGPGTRVLGSRVLRSVFKIPIFIPNIVVVLIENTIHWAFGRFTRKMPTPTKTRARNRLLVMGSLSSIPPASTPKSGVRKVKDARREWG